MKEDNVILKARAFARAAHTRQVRKYTGEKYFTHPRAVARMVGSVTDDVDMIAAAYLHDVLEDTDVTRYDLMLFFSKRVVELVVMLTDISRPEDGNRETRKEKDRLHIAQASPEAKTIKLADFIDNSRSIVARDPNFAKVYMEEKRLLLDVLREGNSTLWNEANEILTNYFKTRFRDKKEQHTTP